MRFFSVKYSLLLAPALVLLLSCSVRYAVDDKRTVADVLQVNAAAAAEADSTALALIEPYKAAFDEQMNEVLGYSERGMYKDQPEGLLNNFVADLLLWMTNRQYKPEGMPDADLCLLNNGGLRSSLPKGEITMRNVFELMPFDNKIVILEISGDMARRMFNHVAGAQGMPLSGARMGISGEQAVNVLVNSAPFDSTKNYTVVTSDYLANGGDRYTFFLSPLKRTDLNIMVRDAIAAYLKMLTAEGKTVDVKLDKRIYYEK